MGPRTGEALSRVGLSPDLVPGRFHAEGVVEALLAAGVGAGSGVLLPRAEEGRDTIPRLLTAAGAHVLVVSAYRTAPNEAEGDRLARMIADGDLDALTFTAGSAARVFADAWSRRWSAAEGSEAGGSQVPDSIGVLALGPATAEVLACAGIRVDRIAEPHTFEGLASAVRDWAEDRERREGGPSTAARAET